MGFLGPDIEMTVSHRFTPDEVINRMNAQLANKMQVAFPQAKLTNLSQRWTGTSGTFSCSADGRNITGKMSVSSTQLRVEMDLPFGASLAIDVDAAKQAVQRELTELLK